MPTPDLTLPVRNILVLSAAQTYGSAIAAIARFHPVWIVVVRDVDGAPAPFLYAYHQREVLGRPEEWAAVSLGAVLDLHEYQASAVQEEGSAAQTPSGGGGGVSAGRLITVDADGIPIRIEETGAPAGRGPTRSIPRGGLVIDKAFGAGPRPTIEMTLAADGPAKLNPGDVDVIEITAAAAADNLGLRHAVSATGSTTEKIAVLISILGESVKVNGAKVLKIDPPAPGQPHQTAFEIEAVSEGSAQIAVLFRQGGTELASIKLKMQVAQGTLDRSRAAGKIDGGRRAAGDDGVLLMQVDKLIQVDKNTGATEIRYQYRVHCPRLNLDFAQFESPKLLAPDGSAATSELAFVQRIYSAMTNKMLRTESQVARFANEVEAFGEDLCAQLFPRDLIQVLWDGRPSIDCIRVMSWEPYIPWELVKLALPGPPKQADDKFLSEYGMVRWLNGRSAPKELPLKDWSYYAATYPNNPSEDVTKEVAYLTTELAKHNIQATHVPSTYDAFAGAWQTGAFDVFHVACHGDVKGDDIDKAELVLTDELVNGRPQYISISANVVGRIAQLWKRRPLVFLNACEAGRLGESLTAWGGWPKKLIASGAGVVVGASWPVRDVASSKFAEAFYDALLAGESLAVAATQARIAASTSGDATWVSFKVFGDPHATLKRSTEVLSP